MLKHLGVLYWSSQGTCTTGIHEKRNTEIESSNSRLLCYLRHFDQLVKEGTLGKVPLERKICSVTSTPPRPLRSSRRRVGWQLSMQCFYSVVRLTLQDITEMRCRSNQGKFRNRTAARKKKREDLAMMEKFYAGRSGQTSVVASQ